MPAGQVSEENPAGGSKVGKGSTVTLTVSTGIPQVQVPSVIGQDVNQAVASLAQLGLDPNIVRDLLDRAGRHRHRAAAACRRPRAEGDEGAHQRLARREAGAGPRRDRRAVRERQVGARRARASPSRGSTSSPTRRRASSSPPTRRAGSSVAKGSKVTLSVSKGPATTQIPDVTGQSQADATSLLAGRGPDRRGHLRPGHRSEPGRDRPLDGPGGRRRREGGRDRDDPRRAAVRRRPAATARPRRPTTP